VDTSPWTDGTAGGALVRDASPASWSLIASHIASDINARYAQLWDDARFGAWIALFDASAATFDQRGRIYRGVEEIQAMIGSGNPARPEGAGLHVMANTVVVSASDAEIAATADFQYLFWRDRRYDTFAAGRTYSRFAPTSDGWRIRYRAVRFIGDAAPDGW
jgi:3-phenylpropionate/cinnamic acid dioxygenase small subunit